MFDNKLISIDIGNKNIHIAEGSLKRNLVELSKTVMVPTPSGAIRDGRIEDLNSLGKAVAAALTQNRIRTRETVLTTHSTAIITREIVFPTVPKEKLSSMIQFEMEQYLPTASNEYIIEYKILEELEEGSARKTRILAAAMPRDMADGYYNLIKSLHLKPAALDTHSNSISKLFSKEAVINGESYNPGQTVAAIDMGYQSTNINIISKGKLAFSRTLPLAGRSLDTAISNYLQLSLDKAEEKKVKDLHLGAANLSDASSNSLEDCVKSITTQLTNEFQKVFLYYSSRGPANKVERVYLYGGGSSLNGVEKFLEGALGLRTRKLETISTVKTAERGSSTRGECFINAIGAILRF